eukprot:5870887-Pyramimonas_sp.AAC.1
MYESVCALELSDWSCCCAAAVLVSRSCALSPAATAVALHPRSGMALRLAARTAISSSDNWHWSGGVKKA